MEIQYKQATRVVIRDGTGKPVVEITDSVIRTGDGYDVEIARPPTEYATLDEIESISAPVLIPRQVAGYLGCSTYGINLAAHNEPESLGFPVIVIGNRVKIPKEGFINFCRGRKEQP